MLISSFSAKKIKDFENARGIKLPEQLKLFLIKYNGGETPNTSFSLNNVSSDIVAFYGIGEVTYSYNEIEIFECNDEKLLPIAFDSFGNDILISLDFGKIFFRDHETDDFIALAEDLRTFMQACKSEAIDPDMKKSIQEREEDLIKRGRANIITDELRKMWQAEIDKFNSLSQEEVLF